MTTGESDGTIHAVLSVADAERGRDHTVRLVVRGPGRRPRSATALLDGGLADGLATDPTIGASLDYNTHTRDRAAAGDQLAAALLSGRVAELWAHAARLAAGQPLRVRLDIQPKRLRALPWELLRGGAEWVFLRQNMSSWRGPEPPETGEPDRGPLRVLLVVCNPRDRRVMADDELAVITGVLAGQPGRVFVEILDGPDRLRLSQEVDRLRPHILHFIGHGMPRIGDQDPGLSFNWVPGRPDPENSVRPWSLFSHDVSNLADWHPRLVVINACRTAGDPLDPIGGFAEAFLAAGARAVVSMQADVNSPAAVLFSTALYEGLGKLDPLDEVVARARRRLSNADNDAGAWALPVLAATTDPAHALRVEFAREEPAFQRVEYGQLKHFLDRYQERRAAWWALDPQPEQDPPRPVLVVGGQPINSSKAGKTWFTHWCLLTCFLRGHRVTYVDLARPLRRPGQDGRPGPGTQSRENKDWLDVIRAIREACTDARQLQPLSSDAFGLFNASLNALAAGRPADDVLGPEEDDWQPFNPERRVRRNAPDRPSQIWSAFLTTLRDASAGCPHIIALDGAESILPEAFENSVYPNLIRPVAEDMQSIVRLVLVASDEWLGQYLPGDDRNLWTWVHLHGFKPAEYMRLARDYCIRHHLNLDRALALYEAREPMYIAQGAVPPDAFDDTIKGVPKDWLATTP